MEVSATLEADFHLQFCPLLLLPSPAPPFLREPPAEVSESVLGLSKRSTHSFKKRRGCSPLRI